MLQQERLTEAIIGAAIEVHRELGPGLLESAYQVAMEHELHLRGLRFRKQVDLPVTSKGVKLECGYRIDLVVEDAVVIELKATTDVLPVFQAQPLTYLKPSGKSVGLLINFHVPALKDGITRRVL